MGLGTVYHVLANRSAEGGQRGQGRRQVLWEGAEIGKRGEDVGLLRVEEVGVVALDYGEDEQSTLRFRRGTNSANYDCAMYQINY